MKHALFVIVSAAALIAQSGCRGSSRTAEDAIPIGKSFAIELSPEVSLEMVKLPNGRLFGKYEITQGQWDAVMGDNNPPKADGTNNPVANVSWDDCQVFLYRLNHLPSVKETGLAFRLPMEEEWDYACLAGSTKGCSKHEGGVDVELENLEQIAWFEEISWHKVHPVGKKKPNAFGLYDMLGNVDEWCGNTLISRHLNSRLVPDPEPEHPYKGGNYQTKAEDCLALNPNKAWHGYRRETIGLRICSRTKQEIAVEARNNEESLRELVPQLLQNMVQIPGKDFKMCRYEVTQAEWLAVMGDNPSRFQSGGSYPVENVFWDDCQTFLEKLNALPAIQNSGLVFRLPTEEEWIFACRAGADSDGEYCKAAQGLPFASLHGYTITEYEIGEFGLFKENSAYENTHTFAVGDTLANAYGLRGMFGNVAEWVQTEMGEEGFCLGGSSRYSSYSALERLSGEGRLIDGSIGLRLCAMEKTKEFARLALQKQMKEKKREAVASILSNMIPIPGKDYKIGKTEVTQMQWEAIMGKNPSIFKNPDNPVENVSWDDCQFFLEKLNVFSSVKKSGLIFRLPSEDEWEYACRAGAMGDYSKLANGTEITESTLGQVAWFRDNADGKTHPIGQKKPNAFGLYDMHGNVCEWTSTAHGGNRVLRGGSWFLPARFCESSFRSGFSPSLRDDFLGFRLCASGRVD